MRQMASVGGSFHVLARDTKVRGLGKSTQGFVASKPIANVQQLYQVVELANALIHV